MMKQNIITAGSLLELLLPLTGKMTIAVSL